MDGDTISRLAYLAIILVALGGWAMVEFRQRMGQALRMVAAWGLIFLAMMAGYGLWTDIRSDIMPTQMVSTTGAIEVPRAADGHYYLTLEVNGTPVVFMADTGATNMVLSRDDARRLGIEPDSLLYVGEASTANGVVRTARVELPLVELGPFRNESFPAWVNDAEMDGSLLGMDYLGQFRLEIDGDKMVLRQ
ncbi:TIGR02281 family clan AA aspartic protease [Tabrizicola sp.]|uniref:retropepsin-like aspartic protease family protein n=1 Tax=Tabrizicola sp. TaxID=2005166 RepID=UPI00286CCBFD|nr:TIGR02281 family clan AA aspartic protease [Tabrizicola sp.]